MAVVDCPGDTIAGLDVEVARFFPRGGGGSKSHRTGVALDLSRVHVVNGGSGHVDANRREPPPSPMGYPRHLTKRLWLGAESPLNVLGFGLIGFGLSWRSVWNAAKLVENRRVFIEAKARVRAQALQRSTPTEGSAIAIDALTDPLLQLTRYAQAYNPNWIVGVHVGGRILSAALTSLLSLKPENCLFVSTHFTRNRLFVLESHEGKTPNQISGRVLVVDDIVRTGNTLRNLRTWLMDHNHAQGPWEISDIAFATLIVATDGFNSPPSFRPDWMFHRTRALDFALPWTELSRRISEAFDNRDRGRQFDQSEIDQHEMMARDFSLAIALAKKYLPLEEVVELVGTAGLEGRLLPQIGSRLKA